MCVFVWFVLLCENGKAAYDSESVGGGPGCAERRATTLFHYSSPSPTAAASPWSGVCLRGNVSSNASSSGSLPPAHSAEDRTVGRLHVAAATPPILASRLARTGHVGAPCVVLEVDAGIFI